MITSLTEQHMRPLPALEPGGDDARGVLMLPAPGELARRSSAAAPLHQLTGLVSDAATYGIEQVTNVVVFSAQPS